MISNPSPAHSEQTPQLHDEVSRHTWACRPVWGPSLPAPATGRVAGPQNGARVQGLAPSSFLVCVTGQMNKEETPAPPSPMTVCCPVSLHPLTWHA